MTRTTAAALFDDIWREWGVIDPSESAAQARKKALSALEAWMKGAPKYPARVIQAVQTLQADPEIPGICNRASVKAVLTVVQDVWASVGANPAQDLQFLQAMLLAVWPVQADRAVALAELLDSPWAVVTGRERQRPRVEAWRGRQRGGAVVDTQNVSVRAWKPEVQWRRVEVLAKAPSLSNEVLNTTLRGVKQHGDLWNLIAPVIREVHQGHASLAEALTSSVDELTTQSNVALEHLASQLLTNLDSITEWMTGLATELKAAQRPSPELPLLWWGQARYCFSEGKPFRRIKNADQALLWAAREVAERGINLDAEPTCAYLIETLQSLGHGIDEERTLADWARGLTEALLEAGDRAPAVDSILAKVVEKDALGLPVTWLRIQAAGGKGLDRVMATLKDATLLPLQASIDRGTWASWVLHEWLFDLRWQALLDTK